MLTKRKAFSLIEIIVATMLMVIIVLAVGSIDISSRRFFGTAKDETWIQDEAKIVIGHMLKNVQLGIGDMVDPSTDVGDPPPGVPSNESRGFLVLNAAGNRIDTTDSNDLGTQLWVKIDENEDGQFTTVPPDRVLLYSYDVGNKQINFDPDISDVVITGEEEVLALGIVQEAIFSPVTIGVPGNEDPDFANQVNVTITVRVKPNKAIALDNPETTLTSSIILRAMSTN